MARAVVVGGSTAVAEGAQIGAHGAPATAPSSSPFPGLHAPQWSSPDMSMSEVMAIFSAMLPA